MNRKWLDNDTNDSLAIWLYDDITDYPLSCTIGHIHGWPKVQDLFRQLYEMMYKLEVLKFVFLYITCFDIK